MFTGDAEQLFTVGGKQCLVSGDDGFAALQCSDDEFAGDGSTANEFDDDVDIRVVKDFHATGGEHALGQDNAAVGGDIEVGDAFEYRHEPRAVGDELAIVEDCLGNAGTDRPKTDYANIDCFHTDVIHAFLLKKRNPCRLVWREGLPKKNAESSYSQIMPKTMRGDLSLILRSCHVLCKASC